MSSLVLLYFVLVLYFINVSAFRLHMISTTKPNCIYLVGMMGCGKTTVGKELSRQLGYKFIDTDSLLEIDANRSIREIFDQNGEASFREMEHRILKTTVEFDRAVISTGGGIVLREDNWNILRSGKSVFIDVALDVLLRRLQASPISRPLYCGKTPAQIADILSSRIRYYGMADFHVKVPSNDNPTEIARKIREIVSL